MALVRGLGPGRRLFAVFAALSLLPVLGLGALLAVANAAQARDRGVAQGRDQAQVIARVLAETQLTGHDLGTGLTAAERARVESFAASEAAAGTILRMRIRARDQRVVWTSDGTAPAVFDDEAAEAATGESPADITRLDADAKDGSPGPRVVEVYTPLRDPVTRRTTGVLEIYLPYEPIARDLQAGLRRIYLMLGIGLFALYLVLAGLSGWITRRLSRLAGRFQYLATHDVLTGRPNRAGFGERLTAALRDGTPVAVLLLDLDRFREVNDTLGQRNGDELLARIADRLAAAVGPAGTVGRLGGDEFGLLLPGVGGVAELAGREVTLRAAVEDEVQLAGLPVTLSARAGVAFGPADGTDAELLLQRAGIALHESKRQGGGPVAYTAGLDTFDPEQLALVAELRRAIRRDELVLHYQPQLDQRTGACHTLEALVRWRHPTRGLLGPDTFVPVAERTGLVDDLTVWVLDHVLAELAGWRRERPGLTAAVNVSARNLQHPQFPRMVTDALERAGATPDWLLLEITETALVTDAAHAAGSLQRLSAAGLRLSLDDFGQGYTSLSQLSRLPIDELKIDKAFVLNMPTSPGDAQIVRSVIDLGHNLGLDVVAEGVEDEQALAALRELGCDIAQGYLLSRPLPADQIAAWLDTHAAGAGRAAARPGVRDEAR